VIAPRPRTGLVAGLRVRGLLPGLLLALVGCLRVPENQGQPTCSTNDDCDRGLGQVCDEGVCWGGPPPGPWAAVVGAPSAAPNLVAVELPDVTIPDAGWLGDLALDAPVTLTGRLQAACLPPAACDPTSLDATVTVSRPSLFRGGPGFRAVVSSRATVDGPSFTASVPRTRLPDPARPDDPPYTITILPAGRNDGPAATPSAAQLVPPTRLTMAVTDNTALMTVTLGGPQLPHGGGRVLDALGRGLAGYRVIALGRWDGDIGPTEVSTVAYTQADGSFQLTLADGLVQGVEIVATPPATAVAPALHLGGISANAITTSWILHEPADVSVASTIEVPVEGPDSGGEIRPVVGARVLLSADLAAMRPSTEDARYEVEQLTDASGLAHLPIILGAFAGSYTISVIPPANSNLGVVYGQPLALPTSGALPTRRLDPRIALRGTLVDDQGAPIGNVSVTARPALRFLWSLTERPQEFLAAVAPATTTTPSNGGFVIWVDPIVDSVWGHYDLSFEPASGASLPSWQVIDVEIPRDRTQTSVDLGPITLPRAAFIHGRVVDPTGVPVAGGEVRLFQVAADTSVCTQVTNAPAQCVIPAALRGHATADDQGIARLALPRP
jgi:hypothetical protein